jgi:hypothetical protein
MKRDFNTLLLSYDGQPTKNERGENITLATIAVNALNAHFEDERAGFDEKLKRCELSRRLFPGGEQEISSEEITLIKTLVGRLYPPIIVGEVHRILEEK